MKWPWLTFTSSLTRDAGFHLLQTYLQQFGNGLCLLQKLKTYFCFEESVDNFEPKEIFISNFVWSSDCPLNFSQTNWFLLEFVNHFQTVNSAFLNFCAPGVACPLHTPHLCPWKVSFLVWHPHALYPALLITSYIYVFLYSYVHMGPHVYSWYIHMSLPINSFLKGLGWVWPPSSPSQPCSGGLKKAQVANFNYNYKLK